jgi:diguanylate cyclase (GGDEF)-like protein/PAS domain S-box-containing protein
MVLCSFLLMPAIAHSAATLFHLVTWQDLIAALHSGILPGFILLMIAWMGLYSWLLVKRVENWVARHPHARVAPPEIHTKLRRFSRDFWAFYLCYVLVAPQAFYFSVYGTSQFNPVYFGQFLLLQLVCAILIGLPIYLLTMDTLGRIVSHIGVTETLFSVKSKLMLLGGFVPLLTNAVLVLYYWSHTNYISPQILIMFGALGLISVAITLLSVHGMSHALAPVQKVLATRNTESYEDLARMRPQSTDEIGYLTQMLAMLFQHLGNQKSHMRAIVDTASEGIIVANNNGLIITFNPTAEQLFGYQAVEIIGQPVSRILPDINLTAITRFDDGDEHETRGRHFDGREIPVSIRVNEMQQTGMSMYACMVADISGRKKAESKLRETEARYRELVETAHDLVWSIDTEGKWLFLNAASHNIYGYAPQAMIGRSILDYSAIDYLDRDQHAIKELLNGHELVQYETVHMDASGIRHHLSFNASPQLDTQGKVVHIRGTARDITEQKAYEQQLTYQAEHDSLTGLYNRHYFQEELERLVARVARSGASAALLYIDLDQFKYINDTLGHAAGDRLLLEATHLLREHVREGDLLARFGGDEFTLLFYNIDAEDAELTAQKIRKLFEDYAYYDSGNSFNVTCSIGVALIDNTSKNADETLAQADLACNLAKTRGRNRVYVYDPEDSDQLGMAEDMGWAARVREVLDNDRFQLAYQPIVDTTNGELYSYEVLLRMPYDDGQIILPGGFLPAAERFGLIHAIDRWMVAKAIRTLADERHKGHAVRFAINLSGRAFEDDSLLPLIRAAISESGLEPSSVTFEITETAAIANLNAATRFITSLREIGCRFALDDFGSGFCSFTYLKHLPVDTLKIDGSFVQGLANAPVDQAMVQSMNQVAHALGKKTIAESVENEQTLLLLREFGVDYAQGHFIGRPSYMLQ